MNDRALNLLRHVVVPIIVAAISGYFVKQTAREQTKASYEALAPVVRDLQEEVTKLQGRVDELSKTTRVIVMRETPTTPRAPWDASPAAKPIGSLGAGKVEVQAETAKASPKMLKKPAANFDDMLRGL